MSKIKITDLTNDSLLVDVSADEAAKISGGNGWSPNLSSDLFYASLGFYSTPAYYLKQNSFTTHEPDFSNSGIYGIDANLAGILNPLYRSGIRF